MKQLRVPLKFHRNFASAASHGGVHSGDILIHYACNILGVQLAEVDILDVGCGVRFAQTIINKNLKIKSYTGIDVDKEMINFLAGQLSNNSQFNFYHLDVINEKYNRQGTYKLEEIPSLPVKKQYDVIWLFSVFTHLEPADASHMLKLLKPALKQDGKLLFSAHIDNNLDGFEDRYPDDPLALATYGKIYMEKLISDAGWELVKCMDPSPENYIQAHFICQLPR